MLVHIKVDLEQDLFVFNIYSALPWLMNISLKCQVFHFHETFKSSSLVGLVDLVAVTNHHICSVWLYQVDKNSSTPTVEGADC